MTKGDAPAWAAELPWRLLRVGADDAGGLEESTDRLRTMLVDGHDPGALTARFCPDPTARFRRTALVQDGADAIAVLTQRDRRRIATAEVTAHDPPPVLFMFPGGGSQYAGMAHDLYETDSTFAAHVDACADLFAGGLGLDVRRGLDPATDPTSLEDPRLGLAALFTVEYALARLWMSVDVRPDIVIGHSLGEYVAATLAEVLPLRDAARLVSHRARLMATLPPSAMLIVQLGEAALTPMLHDGLSLAAVNSPNQSVVSGPAAEVHKLEATLTGSEVPCRRLRFGAGAHSSLVDSILGEFGELASTVHTGRPTVAYVSNLTGQRLDDRRPADPDYWVRHLRGTVRFADGMATARAQGPVIALEVGPGTSLTTLARQNGVKPSPISSLRHPLDPHPDAAALGRAAGALWLAGVNVHWPSWDSRWSSTRPHRVSRVD